MWLKKQIITTKQIKLNRTKQSNTTKNILNKSQKGNRTKTKFVVGSQGAHKHHPGGVTGHWQGVECRGTKS